MDIYVDSTSGVTEYAKDTVYAVGARVVPAKADTGTNHAVAKKYVWEVTDIGSAPNKTHATDYPTWNASYTVDSDTEVSGDITFTCRNPGYSSGSTVDWTFATIFFEYAVNYSAASDGDFIYVAHDHEEPLRADTTFTFLSNVNVLCRNSGTDAVTTGAVIGAQATSYSITCNGAKKVFIYGLTLKIPGTGNKAIVVNGSDGGHFEWESCNFQLYTTGITSEIGIPSQGIGSVSANSYTRMKQCVFRFGATAQSIRNASFVEYEGCSIDSGGTTPNNLFKAVTAHGTRLVANGCDFSLVGTALIAESAGNGTASFVLSNCKIPSTVYPAPTTVLNKGQTSMWLYNCSDGDNHYEFAHYDPFGSTVAGTNGTDSFPVFATGALFNGTTPVSWKITTTAYCSFWTPYVSPWIDKYHSATDAITPYVECLRDGTADKYYDTEVWAEFTGQVTSGSTRATFYSDRLTLSGETDVPIDVDGSGSGTLQADGAGYASWTGGTSSDASFKCDSGTAMTPAEIGHLRARVVVAKASISDLYVDPYIRT